MAQSDQILASDISFVYYLGIDLVYSSNLSGGFTAKSIPSLDIALLEKSLNLSLVGGIGDEVRQFLAHLLLSKLVETVELLPELLLDRHRGLLGEVDILKVHSIEDAHGGLETLISLKVCKSACLG